MGPESSIHLIAVLDRKVGVLLLFSLTGEFDPGSERTLAAGLTHASRTRKGASAPE